MLLTLGLNHKTAPVALRETVAITPDRAHDALRDFRDVTGVQEAAILSTCNRTELYCRLGDTPDGLPAKWLHEFFKLHPGHLDPFLYRHRDLHAVRHLLRVAAGVDSMVLGEPEILGQVKEAWRQASEAATLNGPLDRLFQHSFSVAKAVRTQTQIGAQPVSVAYAAVNLARRIFSGLSDKTVMMVGAGDTIELAVTHLTGHDVGHLIVANRTLSRAQELATRFVGTPIPLSDLNEHLPKADIIISSTAANEPVISREMLQTAFASRRRKPVLIVDLAVPRDVEPDAAELEDVFLYCVDDLQEIAGEGLRSREAAAAEAEQLIELQAAEFMQWLKGRQAAQIIASLQQRGEAARDENLERALRDLRAGREPEEVLQRMAHRLTRQLLHAPTRNLRKAADDQRQDLILGARSLFNLDDDNE